jgi:hypothetical protein
MRKVFLALLLLLFPASSFSQTGWLRVNREHETYFKPFVEVRNFKNKEVIFVTSKGKVYSGKCKLRKKAKRCRISPGKRFPSASENILFIILKLNPYSHPQILKHGTIDNFNIITRP